MSTSFADMHSGVYGGSVANPARIAAELVVSLHHRNGSVAISGFYDGIEEVTDVMRDDAASVPFDEQVRATGSLCYIHVSISNRTVKTVSPCQYISLITITHTLSCVYT